MIDEEIQEGDAYKSSFILTKSGHRVLVLVAM